MVNEIDILKKKHEEQFGEKPELIVHAPGRVNLIGEHTDYSKGYVLPVALNMGITLAISEIPDKKIINVYSLDFNQKMVARFVDLVESQTSWFNYPIGVVHRLLKEGYEFNGCHVSFTGNIPQGAGLSSSAALELSIAYGIQSLFNLKISGEKLAKICQMAEHDIVGVYCGIMDQFITRMGKENHAMFIDCRSLDYEFIPLNLKTAKFIITNTNKPHKLSSSKYNERVKECREAVEILSTSKEGEYLRDFTLEDYKQNKRSMPENIQKRVFHVISENQRVLESVKRLKEGNLKEFGRLMNDSHNSLKIYYEVSSKELDWLTDIAKKTEGCYGSKLTGAGFGGCTITLIEKSAIELYKKKLDEYEELFGFKPIIYQIEPHQGVHVVWKQN